MTRPRRQTQNQSDDMLDPHRREEIAGAAVEVSGRLLQKGIEVRLRRRSCRMLADLLSAVERFETAVIKPRRRSMVNTPTSSDPQDPAFVLPLSRADEVDRRVHEAHRRSRGDARGAAGESRARRASSRRTRRPIFSSSAIEVIVIPRSSPFRHVVDGEERDRGRLHRFHLNPGSFRSCARASRPARRAGIRRA